MSNNQEIINLWKELNVGRVVFEFSCGGDSMNDSTIFIYDKNDNEIESDELNTYFDSEVYHRVEFYVNSDGHYQGEAGEVEITLEEEDDDFTYSKMAQSEWSENISSTVEVELSEGEITFIKDKVLNMNGSMDDFNLNYKIDCILSDKEEEYVSSIENEIKMTLRDFCPDSILEVDEWYSFTTNAEEGQEIQFTDNKMLVEITNTYTTYTDSND
jgi:hypothetical protein